MTHDHCPHCGKPVQISLLRITEIEDISDAKAKERIIKFMKKIPKGMTINTSTISEELHLPFTQAVRIMNKLQKEGQVEIQKS